MKNYIFVGYDNHFKPGSSRSDLKKWYRHNERIGEQSVNIDPSRSHLNQTLISTNGKDYCQLVDEALSRSKSYGAMTKPLHYNTNLLNEMVVSCSSEMRDRFDAQDWAMDVLDFMDKTFNPPNHEITYKDPVDGQLKHAYTQNIAHAVLHLDESAPHIHFIVIPMTHDGTFRLTDFVPNKYGMYKLLDELADVGAKYGLRRGNKNSPNNHQDHAKYRSNLLKAITPETPRPEKGEAVDAYYERVADHESILKSQMYSERLTIEDERNAAVGENITIKKTLGIMSVDHDQLEDVVREFRSAKDKVDILKEALDTCPDRKLASETRSNIDEVMRLFELSRGKKKKIADYEEMLYDPDPAR